MNKMLLALVAAMPLLGASGAVRLERDVPVHLRLKRSISSETAHINDRVEFEVVEDVAAAGTIVISKGSTAWGRVTDASPAGRLMHKGRLAIDIESVAVANGGTVKLRASANVNVNKPRDAAADALGALPALPFTMFQYGKGIEIPAGKLVTVYTATAITIGSHDESKRAAHTAEPLAVSSSVLPAVQPAPASAPAADGNTAPEREMHMVPQPVRGPVTMGSGNSRKLITILAVGAAAGLAGVLAAKGHGGSSTAVAPGTAPATPPTTVGIGGITVGGPH